MPQIDAILRTVQLTVGIVGDPVEGRRLLDAIFESTVAARPWLLDGVGGEFVDVQLDPRLRMRSRSLEWSGLESWRGFGVGCNWVVLPGSPRHRTLLATLGRAIDGLVVIPGERSTRSLRLLGASIGDRSLSDIPTMVYGGDEDVDVLRRDVVARALEQLTASDPVRRLPVLASPRRVAQRG